MPTTEQLLLEIKADLSELNKAYRGASRKTDQFSDRAEKRFKGISSILKTLGPQLSAAFAVGVVTNFARVSVRAFSDFEDAMISVNTILKLNNEELKELSDNARGAAVAVGETPQGFATAMYQAVSAGVELGDVVNFVTVATKLAKSGFATTTQAVDLLTTIMNAYGDQVGDVVEISNILLVTQNRGKTRIDEMAQSMGQLIPIAAALGVDFEVLSGAVATLTAAGINTAETITALRSLLVALSAPSDAQLKVWKQLGINWNQARLTGNGLIDIIAEISEKSEGQNKQLTALGINQRALNAILSLGGERMSEFAEGVDEARTATGTLGDSFSQVSDSISGDSDRLKAAFSDLGITIGNLFNKPLRGAVVGLTDYLRALQIAATFTGGTFAQRMTIAIGVVKNMREAEEELGDEVEKTTEAFKGQTGQLAAFNTIAGATEEQIEAITAAFLSGDWETYEKLLAEMTENTEEWKVSLEGIPTTIEGIGERMSALSEIQKRLAVDTSDFIIDEMERVEAKDIEVNEARIKAAEDFASITESTIGAAFDQLSLALAQQEVTWESFWQALQQAAIGAILNIVEEFILGEEAKRAAATVTAAFLAALNFLTGGLLGTFSQLFSFGGKGASVGKGAGNSISGFADGGRAAVPQLAMIGERVPEIIAPERDFIDVLRGMSGQAVSNPRVAAALPGAAASVFNINIGPGTSPETVRAARRELIPELKNLTRRGAFRGS